MQVVHQSEAKQATTLAVPLIGAGQAQWPCNLAAKVQVAAILKFARQHTRCNLKVSQSKASLLKDFLPNIIFCLLYCAKCCKSIHSLGIDLTLPSDNHLTMSLFLFGNDVKMLLGSVRFSPVVMWTNNGTRCMSLLNGVTSRKSGWWT